MKTMRRRRGSSILSLLMGLMLIGIMTSMYMTGGGPLPAGTPPPQQTIDRVRDQVCSANRQSAISSLLMAQIDHGPNMTPEQIERVLGGRRICPGEGRIYVSGNEIYCTQHSETVLFRELLLRT